MEFAGYLRFLLALAFVLGLIGLLAILARRMGFGYPAGAIKNAKNRRLSVVESTPLDGRRRMVLVRRDDTEHLILMGPTSELLIESGIKADPDPAPPIEDKS
jgi:flagellar protein FliO/FliZ